MPFLPIVRGALIGTSISSEDNKPMDKIERFALKLGRLRRLLKGPDLPLSDPKAWTTISGPDGLGGKKPVSKMAGVDNFLSWVYICAKLNAQAVSAVPFELYAQSGTKGRKWRTISTRDIDRRTERWLKSNKGIRRYVRKSEEVEQVLEHPLIDLMQSVNPFMNSSDLMELTVLFMDLAGEAYWYVVKNKLGAPAELWPIPPMYIKPIPGKTLKDFIAGYEYQRGTVKQTFSVDEIIYFAYPNPKNQYQGMSIVQGVCDAVYTNTKMYEYEESLFENKARTGGMMETSTDVSGPEVARLREEWRQRYVGTDKAGETAILPPGLKFIEDTMTNEELSFIEGRRITREEIAAAFDTPISLWDQAAIRANVEGAQYFHARYGILPRLRKIEEKINEKLIPMFDDQGILFCAFENPVPEDKVSLLGERTGYVNAGIMSRNEVRTDMGLEAVEGGDELMVPFSAVPLSQVVSDQTEPEPDNPPVIPGQANDEDAEDDAAKIADLTLAKLRERLGVKGLDIRG